MSQAATFDVRVEASFRASHRVGPNGESAAEHEHDWRVVVRASSIELDRISIVVDFRKLHGQTEELLDELRGTALENHPELGSHPATAERVARWLLRALVRKNLDEAYRITAVEVGCDRGIDYILSVATG
ncbi:MAG TPA: 6-carboxytetrahydropterin synthase [Acidobacteriota bacterium]|nr:6-carboxytetrahydropterin synthase [Acidobacteriota bacterium]